MKKILAYANAGESVGMGHLYRLTCLVDKYFFGHHVDFLVRNEHQESFYLQNNLNFTSDSNLNEKEEYIIFLDTKESVKGFITKFPNSKFIVIDNVTRSALGCDYRIYPSYYFNEDNLLKYNLPIKNTFFGPQFMILRDEFIKSRHKKREYITITFGGTDPNNLTLKVLEAIANTDLLKSVRCILGPSYAGDLDLLLEILPSENLVINPKYMSDFYCKSKCVITALGTTLQETFSTATNTLVICNYLDDLEEENEIINASKRFNRNEVAFAGHYSDLDSCHLVKLIRKFQNLDDSINDLEKDIGIGWRNLSNIIGL